MRRGRSGIAAELVPLVLILACLAGSLALVIAIHRRFVSRSTTEKPAVAVVATPLPPKPSVAPPPAPPSPEVEEPEPPPPAPPEDPTPKMVAKLVAAEADQLLEASRADRKAAALEEARKAALVESERWRRRESLVRLQLDSLQTKVHQLETNADELALERDALEKEVDARKALAAQARSRPSTAILPHRGQNGTWRRPIVIECVNGMAILRPQNTSFGLLDMAMGFGPASNPFVAAVAREAIRIQGNNSPDGQLVTPYIFFLIRPDGIRTYYEARGRLEPLGITFGYELADQDWDIDFPDLDDVKSWDGSGPSVPPRSDPLARLKSRPSGSDPEDENFANLGAPPGRGASNPGNEAPGGDFTWPPRRVAPSNGRVSLGGSGVGAGSGGIGSSSGSRDSWPAGAPGGLANLGSGGSAATGPRGGSGGGGIRYPGGTSGVSPSETSTGVGTGPGDLPPLVPPRELALGGPITPLPPTSGGYSTPPAGPDQDGSPPADPAAAPRGPASLPPVVSPRTSPPSVGGQATNPPQSGPSTAPSDPGTGYVLPSPGMPDPNATTRPAGPRPLSPNQTPPVIHRGPFSRPFSDGLDPALFANPSPTPPRSDFPEATDPTQPDTNSSGTADPASTTTNPGPSGTSAGSTRKANSAQGGANSPPGTQVIGPGDSSASPPPSGSPPPPFAVGLASTPPPPVGTPPMATPPNITLPPDTQKPPKTARPPVDPSNPDNFKVARKFEVVVVCNQHGVTIQPGAYRATVDALKTREGLLKTQIVALVKAKRTEDPTLTIEPRVRFLVQPGGEKTYWTARGQFLLSGLDWPMSMQVAEHERLLNLPSESW